MSRCRARKRHRRRTHDGNFVDFVVDDGVRARLRTTKSRETRRKRSRARAAPRRSRRHLATSTPHARDDALRRARDDAAVRDATGDDDAIGDARARRDDDAMDDDARDDDEDEDDDERRLTRNDC